MHVCMYVYVCVCVCVCVCMRFFLPFYLCQRHCDTLVLFNYFASRLLYSHSNYIRVNFVVIVILVANTHRSKAQPYEFDINNIHVHLN